MNSSAWHTSWVRNFAGLGFLLLGAFASVQAMTIEVVGRELFATGPVGGQDIVQFKTALESPALETVVLVNSPGGDLLTAMTVTRMISERKLRTVSVGYCLSACSILFLGGQERQFSDALRPVFNVIGIHGAHISLTGQIDPLLQPQLYAFYKQRMGDAFDAALMNRALYDMRDSGALLRIPEMGRMPSALVHHCESSRTLRKDCTDFKGVDGLSLGLLTSRQLRTVQLPAAFKEVPSLWGRVLDQTVEDLPKFLGEVADSKCAIEICKSRIMNFDKMRPQRALAVRVSGQGAGWQVNAPTITRAYLRALYLCNHASNLPAGLCEVQLINDLDVRPLTEQIRQEHALALQKLKIPAERFYGNEEFGGASVKADGYRTQDLSQMTPQSLEGITTLGTQALVRELLSDAPPVLIDVWGGVAEVIPGARSLIGGGEALDDAMQADTYHLRFSQLLSLIAPDKSKPLVFYCAGRECWHSVNAALRAQRLGYAQVRWYRGGYSAWKASGLPMAPIQVAAVVQ